LPQVQHQGCTAAAVLPAARPSRAMLRRTSLDDTTERRCLSSGWLSKHVSPSVRRHPGRSPAGHASYSQRPGRPCRAANSASARGRRAGPAAAKDDAVRVRGLPARPLHAAARHARAHHGLCGDCHLAVRARAASAPRLEGAGLAWAAPGAGVNKAAAACTAPCSGTVGHPRSANTHTPLRLEGALLQRARGRLLAGPAAQHRSVSMRMNMHMLRMTARMRTARAASRAAAACNTACPRAPGTPRRRRTTRRSRPRAARCWTRSWGRPRPACTVPRYNTRCSRWAACCWSGAAALARGAGRRRSVMFRACCPMQSAARRCALNGVRSRVDLQTCPRRGELCCAVMDRHMPVRPEAPGCAGLCQMPQVSLHLPTTQCPQSM